MATTENLHNGTGSQDTFSFTFPYLKDTDVKVSVGGVLKTVTTHYTLHTPTTIKFTSGNLPPSGTSNVRIYRETADTALQATFYPGSSIRAGDLNDNFTQNLYVVQEGNNKIDSAWQTGDETIISTETWHTSDDTRIGTTKAIENRIGAKIDTALESDVLAGTDLAKTVSSGQVTINHSVSGANSTVNNSNGTVLQDITITAQGHVTAIGSYDLDGRYYTETELNAGQLDNRYYTETEIDANFYKLGSVAEIQSGETWSAADNKIATTSAIDARITDLVDDVGGFVPIANETSFPNANPDVNNGAGTLVSIKALSSSITSNGSGVATISNGTVGNSTVTITGLANSTTYAASFGMIVETTTTLNTYTFHRQVPKATEVTTVAGSISNVNTVAGNNANINTVAGANSNISTVAGSITNVNNVGGSIANVNTVASNLSSVNDFAARYRVASSAPSSSLDVGDLYFDTTGNELKVYNGSAWQGGVTATGNLLSKAGDQMTGNLTFSGSQTVDGRDLSVDGTKLDGIAASANNYAISADLLDQDDMASDSATKVPSQQSVKAYVDLRAPKASPTFTGTVTTAAIAIDGQYIQQEETLTVSSNATTVDCSTGNYFTVQAAGNITFTFGTPPADTKSYAMVIEVDHNSGTLTWPASVKWNSDTAPTLTTGKTHQFYFHTNNGGTRWRGAALVDYVD